MRVTALCTRSDGWWAVVVPEVDGAITQARRLDQVPAMVADAVALLAGEDPTTIEVDVQPEIPAAVRRRLERAAALRAHSARANNQAAHELRTAAHDLASEGLPLRDVGRVLGVSYQRAHQLVTAAH